MTAEEGKITQFLEQLGLSSEEAAIYLTLSSRGILSTLEISRATSISRTQVYRLLEHLKQKGFVEEVIDEHTTRAKAVEVDRLVYLIKQQEEKTQTLKKSFEEVKTLLLAQIGVNQSGTKVLFYRGLSGLQQMAWNNLRTKGELLGYTYRTYDEAIGKKFFQGWLSEVFRRQIRYRDIYSDEYLKSVNYLPRSQDKKFDRSQEFKQYFEARYLPPEVLYIDHQLDIYNDVVAYYNWYEGEVFGVEIYNDKIARLQKQIFEILWKQAIPEDKLIKKLKTQN